MSIRKTIIVPNEVKFLINSINDKRLKKRILKIYEALLFKCKDNNKFFSVPSSYLQKVNHRYYKVIQLFIKYNIIEYKKSVSYSNDLFNEKSKIKKMYSARKHICMKYRFLVDIKNGDNFDIDIEVDNLYRGERWFNITKSSLIELNLKPRIKRDNFSRRLHTNLTSNVNDEFSSYKDFLKGKGYVSIDSVTSQPRLLYQLLKEVSLYDKNLYMIFENDYDFYDYLIDNIYSILDRDMAKTLFTTWINGTGYLEGDHILIRTLFPIASMYIKNWKSNDYRDLCRLLQYKEASIFIDDLLNNCPSDFGLTIHDSLIVKEEDSEKVLKYCQDKYKDLRFKLEKI